MLLVLENSGLLLFEFIIQIQVNQVLLNDGPISMYFLVLLLQFGQPLIHNVFLYQEAALQVPGNTICMVRSCRLFLPFLHQGPINPTRIQVPMET